MFVLMNKKFEEILDGIRRDIINLFNRLDKCEQLLEDDYKNELVTDDEYRYLKNAMANRFNIIIPEKYGKYTIPKEDIFYLKSVADIDSNNNLTVNIINQNAVNTLYYIYKSIFIYSELDGMDENQLRHFLLNSISEFYNNLLAGYERQIIYQGNPTLYSERNKVVTSFNQQIEYLQNASYDDLYRFAKDYFAINEKHYEWFRRTNFYLQIQNGKIYSDKVNDVNDILNYLNGVNGNAGNINNGIYCMQSLYEDYIIFTEHASILNINAIERKSKRNIFNRTKGLEKGLYEIFSYLVNCALGSNFLKKISGVTMDDKFHSYLDKYDFNVSLADFRNGLVNDIRKYYYSTLKNIKQYLSSSQQEGVKINNSITNGILEIKKFLTLHDEVSEQMRTYEDFLNPENYFSSDELEVFNEKSRRLFMLLYNTCVVADTYNYENTQQTDQQNKAKSV